MPTSTTTSSRTSPRARSSSTRAGASARTEVINALKDDHKRAKKAFRDFEKLDPREDSAACQSIVMKTCSELEIHTTLEEEFLYPAARSCLKDEELIDEAEVEHDSAKALIAQLKSMRPDDAKYAATFKVLGEYVKHHITEEEKEMFPKLTHAKLDWQELQGSIQSRRESLAEELAAAPESQKAGKSAKNPGKANGATRPKQDLMGEKDLPDE